MTTNLLAKWQDLDQSELMILLKERIGGPGQYDRERNPNGYYLPLARHECRVELIFKGADLASIHPGPSFDAAQWQQITEEIERSLVAPPIKVGKEYSFCGRRVTGCWRGIRSGVQITPPPEDAPRAPLEIADHPFILEFPIGQGEFWALTNHRRLREHRRLTLVLNILLSGGASLEPRQPRHFWAGVHRKENLVVHARQRLVAFIRRKPHPSRQRTNIEWVQEFFFAPLGKIVADELSSPTCQPMNETVPSTYYGAFGHDGTPLGVPTDLDDSLRTYLDLSLPNRARFDRAAFWLDIASRTWNVAVSVSFAALVSAIEAMTDQGAKHPATCDQCGEKCVHEIPGATERFRSFLDVNAPGESLASRRSKMYALRSKILHGSDLMHRDEDRAVGHSPPGWNETELHRELWALTRIALRNWLKSQQANKAA